MGKNEERQRWGRGKTQRGGEKRERVRREERERRRNALTIFYTQYTHVCVCALYTPVFTHRIPPNLLWYPSKPEH